MQNDDKSLLLKKANLHFKEKDYEQAILTYNEVLEKHPSLAWLVDFNLKLIEKFKKNPTSKKIRGYFSDYESAFDVEHYLTKYPDIKNSNIDPFQHYISWGWREGRTPNSWFDPAYYLKEYPEVNESGIDPLAEYIEHGQYLNRKTKESPITPLTKDLALSIPKIKFDESVDGYIDYKENPKINSMIKLVAFYLPQFHPFPENDKWWGKGFTEWYNVAKAKPNFKGHYQPHLPIHCGFYDLRLVEILQEQAKLARNYGIHGFNFYYYWFDGKVLMHKPFELLMANKDININFCITWANENWTRRWDGAENDVLIAQNHCEEDSIKIIEHLFTYFRDPRYIRIENKPVFVTYRPNIIPNMKETLNLWRRKALEAGFDGIYLVGVQAFGFVDPKEYGFDAVMEFPPHALNTVLINNESVEITNESFKGYIYDYEATVRNSCLKEESPYKKFRTAMLGWDNSARKQNNSHIFHNFSTLKYKQWLSNIAHQTFNNNELSLEEEKIVFVNAWNEWAEGTHLEPDRRCGYAYLQATYDVLSNFDKSILSFRKNNVLKQKNDIAFVVHIHYFDVWEEILDQLLSIKNNGTNFDLYLTITKIPDKSFFEKINSHIPEAHIYIEENRGRDIRPFIKIYNKIKSFDYKAVCKIHTKKSIYRSDGESIREETLNSLLGSKGSARVNTIVRLFDNEAIGLVVPAKFMINHTEKNMASNQSIVDDLCNLLEISFQYSKFPAGSMFWFKPKALSRLDVIEDRFFELEEGFVDGTLAHSVERIIYTLVQNNGFSYEAI